MKLVIAAAVAAFAMPAIAQDMPVAPPPPMPQPAPMPPAPVAVELPSPNMPPATTDGNYPPCTRTVTDHCTERSNARGERLHSTPRKPV
jgi:hypothetical protein